jgi:hypothetical protein
MLDPASMDEEDEYSEIPALVEEGIYVSETDPSDSDHMAAFYEFAGAKDAKELLDKYGANEIVIYFDMEEFEAYVEIQ